VLYGSMVWRRRNSIPLLVSGLAALAVGGCPPTDPPPDLTVDVTTEGEGTVSQETDGNMVTLTAVPDEGWVFDGWSGAGGIDQNANPLVVDATQIDGITANFIVDEEPPPSPGDSDGDGVRDTLDDCPDTPAGTPVDSSGCTAEGPDGDGDGVPDGADRCGDTASGAVVDATGCAAEQRDGDSDGVNDALDECPSTPVGATVNEVGCPVSQPGTPDDDGDGVANDIDQCADTADGADVDANGCAAGQLDADGDGVNDEVDECPGTPPRTQVSANGCPGAAPPPPPPPQNCGNGVVDPPEECDGGSGGETALCNSNCTTSRCGDGIVNVHSGEQCDDGNTVNGDGCEANCQNGITNELCSAPIAVSDGTRTYSNVGSTTDGPDEPALCDFFNRTNVESDIWFCYTATCTGTALVSLCGSDYDTKLAVYAGCDCPTSAPLACSDDDCGTGVENVQSRVTVAVTTGQKYLVRVGGYDVEQGDGRLTIGCNVDACANGSGDCLAASPTNDPGCGDATCCATTCELDRFCCDVTWDATCAGEAEGVCDGSFRACGPASGVCGLPDNTPGCDNTSCCNEVCLVDPYCCLEEWDGTCVDEAESMCFLTCGASAGDRDCGSPHPGLPGCNNDPCCAAVCAQDPFCCDTEWDQVCADKAATECP